MTTRKRKAPPVPYHRHCGRHGCHKTFEPRGNYYSIAYGAQINLYACKGSPACMVWAQKHVKRSK